MYTVQCTARAVAGEDGGIVHQVPGWSVGQHYLGKDVQPGAAAEIDGGFLH